MHNMKSSRISLFKKIKKSILNQSVQEKAATLYDHESQSPQYLKKYLKYKKENNKRLVLIVSAGRSGNRWLVEIFNAHNGVKGSCEPENYAELFFRYVKWNQLPIDLTGVFNIIAAKVLSDWKEADLSVIASPGLSIDFLEVCKNLEVDEIIWAVNNAKFTINSFYNKDWYVNEVCTRNPDLAIGLQPYLLTKDTRTFGRLIPQGDFFYTWNKLTRVGKISWFYNMYNLRINEQLKEINSKKIWIFKLEEADQNYDH